MLNVTDDKNTDETTCILTDRSATVIWHVTKEAPTVELILVLSFMPLGLNTTTKLVLPTSGRRQCRVIKRIFLKSNNSIMTLLCSPRMTIFASIIVKLLAASIRSPVNYQRFSNFQLLNRSVILHFFTGSRTLKDNICDPHYIWTQVIELKVFSLTFTNQGCNIVNNELTRIVTPTYNRLPNTNYQSYYVELLTHFYKFNLIIVNFNVKKIKPSVGLELGNIWWLTVTLTIRLN